MINSQQPKLQVQTPEQIIELARKVSNLRDRAFFILDYLSGGRVSEICPKKAIHRQKTDKKTGQTTKTLEIINYPGVRKKDIDFITRNGKDFMVVSLLNEKNRKVKQKSLPIPIWREEELVRMLKEYLDLIQPDDVVFPFSRSTAWSRIKKVGGLGLYPHWLRHVRTTHLIVIYHLPRQAVIQYMGWSDYRQLNRYSHLFWFDLADLM